MTGDGLKVGGGSPAPEEQPQERARAVVFARRGGEGRGTDITINYKTNI
jgi:hypothetical protein